MTSAGESTAPVAPPPTPLTHATDNAATDATATTPAAAAPHPAASAAAKCPFASFASFASMICPHPLPANGEAPAATAATAPATADTALEPADSATAAAAAAASSSLPAAPVTTESACGPAASSSAPSVSLKPTCPWMQLRGLPAVTESETSRSGCPVSQMKRAVGRCCCAAACSLLRVSSAAALTLEPAGPFLKQLADMQVRASVAITLLGCALLQLVNPLTLAPSHAFVALAVQLHLFFLALYTLMFTSYARPAREYSAAALEAIARRSTLVFVGYELVAFVLIARAFPAARTSQTAAVEGAAAVKSCCCMAKCAMHLFVLGTFWAHTLTLAAIGGAAAATTSQEQVRANLAKARDELSQHVANMPTPGGAITNVINAVRGEPTAAAAGGAVSKCPFALFASPSAACPHPIPSAASSSSGASSTADGAAKCPFSAAAPTLTKARLLLTCAVSVLTRNAQPLLQKFLNRHASAAPVAQSNKQQQQQRVGVATSQLSPVPEHADASPTPLSDDSPALPSLPNPPSPSATAAAAAVADPSTEVESTLSMHVRASSSSPDTDDGFEIVHAPHTPTDDTQQ